MVLLQEHVEVLLAQREMFAAAVEDIAQRIVHINRRLDALIAELVRPSTDEQSPVRRVRAAKSKMGIVSDANEMVERVDA